MVSDNCKCGKISDCFEDVISDRYVGSYFGCIE